MHLGRLLQHQGDRRAVVMDAVAHRAALDGINHGGFRLAAARALCAETKPANNRNDQEAFHRAEGTLGWRA